MRMFCVAALLGLLSFGLGSVRADEVPAPPPAPPVAEPPPAPPGPQGKENPPAADQPKGARPQGGGGRQRPPQGPQGQGGGGPAGQFQRGGFQFGQMNGEIERMLANQLGLDLPASLDQLPYGEDKRFVLRVPVGGVDNFNPIRDGWKVEDIFPSTDEQSKALEILRVEYKKELEGLQKQLEEANKKAAASVLELRKKYEVKANDVLTGTAKDEKQKLDTIAGDYAKKRGEASKAIAPQLEDLRKESKALQENGRMADMGELWTKFGELARPLAADTKKSTQEAEEAMKAAVTGDAKTKLEDLIKKNEQLMPNQGGRGRGGQQRGQGGQGNPDAPPAPPPAENF